MKTINVYVFAFLIAFACLSPADSTAGSSSQSYSSIAYDVAFTYDSSDGSSAIDNDGRLPLACRSGVAYLEEGSTGTVSIYGVSSQTGPWTLDSTTKIATISSTQSGSPVSFSTASVYMQAAADGTQTTSGTLRIKCSNVASSPGVVIVRSWDDVESAMRSADLEAPSGNNVATESVSLSIVFSDDFQVDPHGDTHVIRLPTGGGEHPQVSIDFNGNIITADALEVVALDFGGGSTKCGSPLGYYQYIDGCMGVSHDYDITVKNGVIASAYDGCDATPTADCGRKAIVTRNADNLWLSATSAYGGRIHIHDMKLGADLNWVISGGQGTSFPSLQLPGDACLEFEPIITMVDIQGGQWDCITAVEMAAWDTGLSGSSSAQIEFGSGFRWTQQGASTASSGTSCAICGAGLLDIAESMSDTSVFGSITASGIRIRGPIGNTRGGNFNFRAHGFFLGSQAATCGDPLQHDESYFINNGTDPGDKLSGLIEFTGEMCTRGWIKSDAIGALHTIAHLRSGIKGLPGFTETDTVLGANRVPVLDSTSSASIEAATFEFEFDVRPDTSDIVYSGLLDADVNSGAAMASTSSYAIVDFGEDGFYQVIGSTPSVYQTKLGSGSYLSGSISPSVDSTTAVTIDADGFDGSFIELSNSGAGAVTVTLPSASSVAPGASKCFMDTAGTGIVALSPQGSDNIILDGVAASNGEDINSPGAIGDYLCMYRTDSTTYRTVGRSGTWVEAVP